MKRNFEYFYFSFSERPISLLFMFAFFFSNTFSPEYLGSLLHLLLHSELFFFQFVDYVSITLAKCIKYHNTQNDRHKDWETTRYACKTSLLACLLHNKSLLCVNLCITNSRLSIDVQCDCNETLAFHISRCFSAVS